MGMKYPFQPGKKAKYKSLRSLLFILLSCSHFVCAQQYPVRTFSTVDGLPNNAVRSLFVDSRGILWIGTENGLAKMDNGRFRSFFKSDGLAFDNCWAIEEDHLNQMWFGSYGGGITLFDGKEFHVFDQSHGLIDNRIRHLYAYQDKILVGTENGISVIHVEEKRVESFPQSQRDPALNYTSGFFKYQNRLFYTTYRQGVFEINFDSDKTNFKKVNDHMPIYAMGQVEEYIYSSNKGHVDVFDLGDFVSGKSNSRSFGQSVVWSYLQDDTGNIFGTAWGIYKEDGGIFLLSENSMDSFAGQSGIVLKNFISSTFDKESKTLYAGTTDKGLFAIHLDDKILFQSDVQSAVLGFVGEDRLEAILYEDGVKLTDSVIFVDKNDFKTGQLRFLSLLKYPLPKHQDDFFELDYETTAENIIFYQIHKNDGHLWINTNVGIFEMDMMGNFVGYLPEHCYVIGFEPTGKLIANHPYGGLRIYEDPNNFIYTYYSPEQAETPTQLASIVSTEEKTFFASVFHGLFELSEKNGLRSYISDGIWDEQKFKAMHLSKSGNLMLGAEFGDLYVIGLEPEFEIKRKIPKSDFIGNGIIFIESYEDAILVGTEAGLNIFQNESIRFIDHEQGLGAGQIQCGKVIEGKLYIGYDIGYYTVDLPVILQEMDYSHDLEILELNVNNRPYRAEDRSWFAYDLGAISLDNNQNNLVIEFKPVGHPYPQKLRYRYRLGSQEDWSPYSTETEVMLSSLSFGKYRLEVETYDLHSGKSKITSLLQFSIAPPFYLDWKFIVLMLVLIGLAVYGIFKWRLQLVREKAETERKVVETKLEALRSQMNPHFIFNAVNSIQYYILGNKGDEALDFLGKFSKLMRNTLENSVQPHIRLSREVAYLENYIELENKRVNDRVDWKIDVPEEIDMESLYVPAMLVQPFVENVFVHAFGSKHTGPRLAVTFSSPEGGLITCVIWDNGSGIEENKKEKFYKSRGMDLVKERLSLLPGYGPDSIQVKTGFDQGTEIMIRIPCLYK